MLSCSKEFEYLKDKRVILREATKKGEWFMRRAAKDEGERRLIHTKDE